MVSAFNELARALLNNNNQTRVKRAIRLLRWWVRKANQMECLLVQEPKENMWNMRN